MLRLPVSRRSVIVAAFVGMGVVALLWAATPSQGDFTGTSCRKIAVIASSASETAGTGTSITSVPCHVCSVSFLATAANGWGLVYDSPSSGDMTHGQTRTVAEPGAATAFTSVNEFYGEHGRDAFFGLGGYVVNGRLTVQYDD